MIRNATGQIIPVYLEDTSGNPVTGVSPSTGQLRVSKSGDTLANALGAWTEKGSGYYTYVPTAPETDTDSYLVLLVTVPGTIQYPIAAFITGELRPSSENRARRVPIWMNDGANVGVPGLTFVGANLQIAVGPNTFGDAGGARGESGGGLYYYENQPSDLSSTVSVLKALGAGARAYVYSYAPGIAPQPTVLAVTAAQLRSEIVLDDSQTRLVIVVPTAINVSLMASENITDNLRARQAASLALPSLYKRAYLIAHETDEIAIVKD